ncbi:MAG: ATP-binding protein [Candidatus Omnitrophica bacterium]|nr:ATP-binding protein [Candidatus Omnitrophota bacterium]
MTQDRFFGRKEYLDILEKRTRSLKEGYRQNIAILGDELIGKSSLVFNFLNKFCDTRIVILYLEARPETLSSFARRFIGILLYNFLTNSGLSLKEDLGFLLRKSSAYIPRTVEKARFILSAIDKRKKNNIFTELLSLPESVHEETGKYCVVILDEFHHLEHMGIKALYTEWSKLLITQKTTMYIIISSMQFRARSILSKNLSLLFGNFQIFNIEPFDINTSGQYLEYRLGPLQITPGLRNFIVHFTGGHPFYLEIISEALLKSGQQERLDDILEKLLFESSGILNQRFSGYLKRLLDSCQSQDCLSILYLIAQGRNKIKEIAHILRKPQKEALARVNELLELDVINRSADFLKINDRVFGFWLKFVYQERMQSLTFDAKNQEMLLRQNLKNMIDEFMINSSKPIAQRLMELLLLFGDDKVQIERKKLRLDHFREIKTLAFCNRSLKDGLIGRSNDSTWILGFKKELLTEDDITDFARECKKYRHKLQRKIIFALKDIDANARLRAMEEKILTWDLSNLNQLLDLYSKPRIII